MLNFLLFFGCYLGGFVLAFASSPAFAFFVYQTVYFISPLDRWWSYMVPSFSYSFFSVILMFVVFFKNYKEAQQNKLFKSPQFKWVYLYAFLYFTTLGFAALPEINKEATINFIKLVVIISIAYKLLDSEKKMDGAIGAYIFGAAYIGFLTFQVGRGPDGRVEGVGTVDAVDSNGIAAAIAPGVVLATYYFWFSKEKIQKFAAALGGAFVANGIVLINSRGSFIAVLGSMAYFMSHLLFSKYQRQGQKLSAVGLILLGLLAASFVVDETAIERFKSMDKEQMTEGEETGATRVFFWIASLNMVRDHPFGVGARGFEFYAPDYLPQSLNTGPSRNRSVHSSWFEALTEVGYVGLFCLVSMIVSCFGATRKCKNKVGGEGLIDTYYKLVAIESALVSYLIAMSFMNRSRAEILYWLILFVAVAYNVLIIKCDEENAYHNRVGRAIVGKKGGKRR